MKIYYLCPKGTAPFRQISNPDGSGSVVRPQGTSAGAWLAARRSALEHAAGAGERFAMVVVGHCDVRHVTRRDWSKPAYPAVECVMAADDRQDHHLVSYTERLLGQYAAMVMVPPYGAIAQITLPWEEHCPVIPMVTAYRVEAALAVGVDTPDVGYKLSGQGYRTITLADFCYAQHGPTVLDEFGTKLKWRKAYDYALEELIGVDLRTRHQRQR